MGTLNDATQEGNRMTDLTEKKEFAVEAEKYEYLQDAITNGNEAGIVIWEGDNPEAIIANFVSVGKGIPRVFAEALVGFPQEEFSVVERHEIPSWRDYIEENGVNIIYDRNNDWEDAEDCPAECIKLDIEDITILAPYDWN